MTPFLNGAATWSLLIVLSAGVAFANDLATISDSEGETVRSRVLMGPVSDGEFTRMVSEILGANVIKLGRVLVYGSTADRVISGPHGLDHCTYETWRSRIDAYRRTQLGCPEVHEAIKVGANIAVRGADRTCRSWEVLLQGTANPRHLTVAGGADAEILELRIGGTGPADEHIGAGLAVRTHGPVTVAIARDIAAQIRAVALVGGITVEVRSDKWFFSDCGFPTFYPFEEPEVPTMEEYLQTKYAACSTSSRQWSLQCFESASR